MVEVGGRTPQRRGVTDAAVEAGHDDDGALPLQGVLLERGRLRLLVNRKPTMDAVGLSVSM